VNSLSSPSRPIAPFILVSLTVVLLSLGIVMLISTGAWAKEAKIDTYFTVKNQFKWLAIGCTLAIIASRLSLSWIEKHAPTFFLGVAGLLVLCYVPFVGERINGSSRWISGKLIGLSSLRLQPSELAKISTVMILAYWYAKKQHSERRWRDHFFIPMGLFLIPVALIAGEVDLGASSLIVGGSLILMFIARTPLAGLVTLAVSGLGGLAAGIIFIDNRRRRFEEYLSFLENPMQHLGDSGMQQARGLMAFASGGLGGVKLGGGQQKLGQLPYAHTDFIFPMIGEELGFCVAAIVIALFAAFLITGLLIANRAKTLFGRLLGIGLTFMLVIQALINFSVTIAIIPNKGIPLPMVSYGGSNLVFCLITIGILLNLSREQNSETPMRLAQLVRKPRLAAPV
jgi:cell division protein FtsW